MYGMLLSRLGWCPQLLLRFVRQATKTDMQSQFKKKEVESGTKIQHPVNNAKTKIQLKKKN